MLNPAVVKPLQNDNGIVYLRVAVDRYIVHRGTAVELVTVPASTARKFSEVKTTIWDVANTMLHPPSDAVHVSEHAAQFLTAVMAHEEKNKMANAIATEKKAKFATTAPAAPAPRKPGRPAKVAAAAPAAPAAKQRKNAKPANSNGSAAASTAVRASEFDGAEKLKATGKTFDNVLFSAGSKEVNAESVKGKIVTAINKVKKADYAGVLKASGLEEKEFRKHLLPAIYNGVVNYSIK